MPGPGVTQPCVLQLSCCPKTDPWAQDASPHRREVLGHGGSGALSTKGRWAPEGEVGEGRQGWGRRWRCVAGSLLWGYGRGGAFRRSLARHASAGRWGCWGLRSSLVLLHIHAGREGPRDAFPVPGHPDLHLPRWTVPARSGPQAWPACRGVMEQGLGTWSSVPSVPSPPGRALLDLKVQRERRLAALSSARGEAE